MNRIAQHVAEMLVFRLPIHLFGIQAEINRKIVLSICMHQVDHADSRDHAPFVATPLVLDQFHFAGIFLGLHAVIHNQNGCKREPRAIEYVK